MSKFAECNKLSVLGIRYFGIHNPDYWYPPLWNSESRLLVSTVVESKIEIVDIHCGEIQNSDCWYQLLWNLESRLLVSTGVECCYPLW